MNLAISAVHQRHYPGRHHTLQAAVHVGKHRRLTTRPQHTTPLLPRSCKSTSPFMASAVEKKVVQFRNANGELLVGDLQLCSDKLVILCHGYMSNRHWHRYPEMADTLASIGISSLRFDFSGNGDSEGTFVLGNYLTEAEDLRAAVEYAGNTLQLQVVAVVGHSKGGDVVLLYASKYDDTPVVINLAGRYDLKQGVLQRFGPDIFERLERDGRIAQQGRANGKTFVWWLTKADMDARVSLDVPTAVTKIQNSKVHTVHGSQDQVIPVEDARLFDRAIKNHVLHVIEGADHNFTGKADGEVLLSTVRGIFLAEGFGTVHLS